MEKPHHRRKPKLKDPPNVFFEVLYNSCNSAAEDSKLEPEMMVFVCGHRRDIPDDVSWLSWAEDDCYCTTMLTRPTASIYTTLQIMAIIIIIIIIRTIPALCANHLVLPGDVTYSIFSYSVFLIMTTQDLRSYASLLFQVVTLSLSLILNLYIWMNYIYDKHIIYITCLSYIYMTYVVIYSYIYLMYIYIMFM